MRTLLRSRLERVGSLSAVPLRVEFSDGTAYRNCPGEPAVTLRLGSPAVERRIALFGHIGLLESYFDGLLEVEGNLALAFRAAMDVGFDRQVSPLVRLRNLRHEQRFSNRSRAQAKANARFHYGLGTDFYRYWLDLPWMMYTCGYWKEGTETVEQAQENKMEHVCRKVRLAPGETVVDIGSGFGGFLFYAHERHGVLPTGINTTTEQVEYVQAEIARRGLTDRVQVIEADFRDIPREFDKSVSIGVLEHAGRDQLLEVVQAHARSVKPGGLGLLHFIGHVGSYETEYFIREHVFPGGWIPSLAETIDAMERCGLEIVDVENLRRHYALTLDAWAGRFAANWEKIRALDPQRFTERFRRVWMSYLVGCAEMFRSPRGHTHLFQITYSRGNLGDDYPMSRAFLYADR